MDDVLSGQPGDVTGETGFHNTDTDGKPPNEGADPTSAAPESASSSPETPTSTSEADGEEFGNCPFCSGYRVPEQVNEETGEITPSFVRPCRRTRCPVCGAINEPYKSSYGQHVADLVDRLGAHSTEVKFLSVKLLKEWAEEAGVDSWEDSYQVLTGDGGPWSKALRRLRDRDPNLVYVGTISARPSDGRAHLHLVVVTRLTVEQVKEAVLRFPLGGHVKTKGPEESTQKFAAGCAKYAFQNHAESPSARFTASRKHGAGYHSQKAKKRRRRAVENAGPECGPARDSVEQSNDAQAGASPPNGGVRNSGLASETDETEARGPPVDLGGETFRTKRGAHCAVRHYLSRRIGTAVHVNGVGRADLLQVKGGADNLRCVVAPVGANKAVTVHWTEIYTRNAPKVDPLANTPNGQNESMSSDNQDEEGEKGPIQRLDEVREGLDGDEVISRFTHERPDGTRRVTEKRADGTTRTYTLDAHE